MNTEPPAPRAGSDQKRRGRRRRGWTAFVVTFVLAFVAMGAWSFATPLFAAPDEPVHIIKAAAVVRGELVGKLPGPSTSPLGLVTVPAFYAGTRNLPSCYHRRPTVPASCAPVASGGSGPKQVYIYNARYPPLYYAIVGLPSLLGSSDADIYLMRLVSAALSAVFIALAVSAAVLWSRSRLAIAGVVIAATPMVLFLGSVVNPAGLEASAAITVWTAGSILVLEHLDDPPPGLVAMLAASACVLELIRALSPFWLGLTAIILLAVSNLGSLRRFLAHRRVRYGLVAVVVVAALAVIWILSERSFDVYATPAGVVGYSVPESTILEFSFLHNDYYLPGMIGVFGWFDTFAPTFTYVVWYALIGFVTLAAAAVGRLRDALTLLVFVVAIVVVPVAISTSQVHRYGFTWAGKDTLAFAVGLPILAATLIGKSALAQHRGRIVGIVALCAFLAQVAAFFEMLRRYAVGTKGPDFGFLLHPTWKPPVSLPGVLAVEIVALGALAVLAYLVTRRGQGVPTGAMSGPAIEPSDDPAPSGDPTAPSHAAGPSDPARPATGTGALA
ncbi:MAG: hypothetical protein JWO62_1302 [Acidimicrobiaceae bacterium]|nr:hypothetical protein [Acidimicrobiaceae bacterium]